MTTKATPAAPAILPAAEQKKWAETYAKALTQAKLDSPGDISTQNQTALREANRVLRVPDLESYEDAMKLAEWQVVKRKEKDGVLKVVTVDGKKYSFDAPKRAKAPEPQK